MGSCIREFCRNAAVDGDGCLYTYWDPDVETGQPSRGAIKTEVLPNTQVLFGNPNSREVQSQPYILIERRMLVREARRRQRPAASAGRNERESQRTPSRAAIPAWITWRQQQQHCP